MNDNWYENEGATEQVRDLLQRTGLTLEIQCEKICQGLSRHWDQALRENLHVRSEALTYATLSDPLVYRDVDQLFDFYEELKIGEYTGVQLMVNCPIECKFRKDVEQFAFPAVGIQPNFPVLGFVGSQLLTNAFQPALQAFSRIPRVRIDSLVIRNGMTPASVCDENLVYNAAGALYDYIAADANIAIADEGAIVPDDLIEAELERLTSHLRKKRFYWASILADWITKVPQKTAYAYYKHYFRSGRFYSSIAVSIPIVCLNGRIFSVSQADKLDFKQEDVVLCSIRKQGWPGPYPYRYYSMAGDVPVIVTNPRGLPYALELIRNFVLEFRDRIERSSQKIEHRWPFEESLYLAACSKFFNLSENRYRSGFEWPLHP